MTLTREEFNRQAFQFRQECMKIAEEWQLLRFENRLCREISIEMESNSATLGEDQIMLRKCETTHCQKSDQLCSREFTIIYSDSYEVPVMYFSMNDQNGAPIGLDEQAELDSSLVRGQQIETVINQVEHPYLFVPVYMIHPCKTRDFMAEMLGPAETMRKEHYLLLWISTIGNLIGLKISQEVAKRLFSLRADNE